MFKLVSITHLIIIAPCIENYWIDRFEKNSFSIFGTDELLWYLESFALKSRQIIGNTQEISKSHLCTNIFLEEKCECTNPCILLLSMIIYVFRILRLFSFQCIVAALLAVAVALPAPEASPEAKPEAKPQLLAAAPLVAAPAAYAAAYTAPLAYPAYSSYVAPSVYAAGYPAYSAYASPYVTVF